VNSNIKLAQSFRGAHKDMVCLFIGVSVRTCISICVCTVFLKKLLRSVQAGRETKLSTRGHFGHYKRTRVRNCNSMTYMRLLFLLRQIRDPRKLQWLRELSLWLKQKLLLREFQFLVNIFVTQMQCKLYFFYALRLVLLLSWSIPDIYLYNPRDEPRTSYCMHGDSCVTLHPLRRLKHWLGWRACASRRNGSDSLREWNPTVWLWLKL
jgi:hypothetical protein